MNAFGEIGPMDDCLVEIRFHILCSFRCVGVPSVSAESTAGVHRWRTASAFGNCAGRPHGYASFASYAFCEPALGQVRFSKPRATARPEEPLTAGRGQLAAPTWYRSVTAVLYPPPWAGMGNW